MTDVLHVSQFQLKYFQFIYRYRVQAVFKKRVICGDRHPQMVYAGLKIYLRSIKSKAVEKYSSKFDSRLRNQIRNDKSSFLGRTAFSISIS